MRLGSLKRLADFDLTKLETWLGLADFLSKDHSKFFPWAFAMNGQTSRLEAARQIIVKLKIKRIIETGTYRGTTTEWFSQFMLPIQSVEISERYFAFSKARLANRNNVSLFRDSSVEFLKRQIANSRDTLDDPAFFYLDSHWQDYLPLREELALISANYPNSIVMVDDFKVPDDPGYEYDDYGVGNALTLEYVATSALRNLSFFFPSTPASEETGARRGCVVLTTNELMASSLQEVSLLRKYSPD